MRRGAALSLLLGGWIAPSCLTAQTDSLALTWQREIHAGIALQTSRFAAAVSDPQGNTYAVGTTETEAGGSDVLVVKYDALGQQLWERSIDGSAQGQDGARWVFRHAAGGVVLAAECEVDVPQTPNGDATLPGVLVAHISAAGEVLWRMEYVPAWDTLIVAVREAVEGDNSSVYLLLEELIAESWPEVRRTAVLKVNGAGDLAWIISLPDSAQTGKALPAMALGASDQLLVAATRRDSSGGSDPGTTSGIFAFGADGTLLRVLDQRPGSTEHTRALTLATSPSGFLTAVAFATDSVRYLRCYDTTGAALWERSLDTSAASLYVFGPYLQFGSDSTLWMSPYGSGYQVELLSSSGDSLASWVNDNYHSYHATAIVDHRGGLRVVEGPAPLGTNSTDSVVVHSFDPGGRHEWRTTFPLETDFGEDQWGTVDDEGNVFVVTTTDGLRVAQALIAKVSSGGELRWINRHNAEGASDASVVDMASSPAGDLYMTGTSLNTAGFLDIFTARVRAIGDPVWVRRFPSPAGKHVIPVAVLPDPHGNVHVAGWYRPEPWGVREGSYLILKYAPEGDLLWLTERAGTAPPEETFQVRGADLDPRGRLWLAGSAGTICVDSAGVIVAEYPRSAYAVTADNEGRVFIAEVDSVRALGATGVHRWTISDYAALAKFLEPDGSGGVVVSIGGFDGGETYFLDSLGASLRLGRGMGRIFVDGDDVVLVTLRGRVCGFTIDGDSLYSVTPLGDIWGLPALAAAGIPGVIYVAAEGDHWMAGPPYPHIGIAGVGSSGETAVRSGYIGSHVAYTPQAMSVGADGGVFIVSDVHTWGKYRRPLLQRYDRLTVGVQMEEPGSVPQQFSLAQNYPNPFNPATTVRYAVPPNHGQAVSVKVYDLLGREIAVLAEGPHAAGVYTVRWDASAAASGVYFCRMTSGGFTGTVKMLLVK